MDEGYKGWFEVPGVQNGDRTVDEQMQGLEGIGVKGRHVLDIGCGEGLIARELCARGAVSADCIGVRVEELEAGRVLCEGHPVTFHACDVRDAGARAALALRSGYDVVLLLSLVHKMLDPHELIRWACSLAGHIVAVRVPARVYVDRGHPQQEHDIIVQMVLQGFRLIAEPATCRGEYLGIFALENLP